jgi:5-methylcytosine-specific restriction endonuclease McrA
MTARPSTRAILEAAGTKCAVCPSTKNLTINHKRPLSFGGTNEGSNLEILCEKHHRQLHGIDKKKRDFK